MNMISMALSQLDTRQQELDVHFALRGKNKGSLLL